MKYTQGIQMALNDSSQVRQQLERLIQQGRRQLRHVALRRAIQQAWPALLLSTPTVPLVALLYRFWQPLPTSHWFVVAFALPVIIGLLVGWLNYDRQAIDRRSVLMQYQRHLQAADGLTTADEFLQQREPLSAFQQAAIKQTLPVIEKALSSSIVGTRVSSKLLCWRYWPMLPIALLITALAWLMPIRLAQPALTDAAMTASKQHSQPRDTAANATSSKTERINNSAPNNQDSGAYKADSSRIRLQPGDTAQQLSQPTASTNNFAGQSESTMLTQPVGDTQVQQIDTNKELASVSQSSTSNNDNENVVEQQTSAALKSSNSAQNGALQQTGNRQQQPTTKPTSGANKSPQRSQQQRPQNRQSEQQGQQQGRDPGNSGEKGQRTDNNDGMKKSHGVHSLLLTVPMLDQLLGQQSSGPQTQQQLPASLSAPQQSDSATQTRPAYRGDVGLVPQTANSAQEQQLLQQFFDRTPQAGADTNQQNN
ncbi:hypothetical protein NJR55_01840 [Idiomarina sp. M1R2S28]|uniref:Uncharacterized protein n=1 Tax=Idiomarina rhizosphaerae TaxID=2961572 RepID=A0A9X2JR01_9GAMM|nr:hypothetical protein [Idiomarina rhizosphaerae]MCP1338323.1 hypothetical protein [Idiomarina rhizosphaerae]